MPKYVKFLKELLTNKRSLNVEKALVDLGASINVMPYKMFKQLGLGYHRGIIEDVLVKFDKFIFPIDFVVLDMDEDIEVPIILGRPFLGTARTIIEVGTGELVLCVGEEKITLQARDFARVPSERYDTNYSVNEIPNENVLEPYFIQSNRT
ncbi:protein kinase 2B, chloroplastic-like [Gossypium australe]|uniref:Protein kinase 2B, chloroplastic-like n=1 Tax=Gossypium australe TaxID=47621 RepID=A0A5B6VZ36_9ROSI|nr:protein kinase 2B, chloroplastic-like [Gossypium australe]